ncbi:MAG: response regulator receiver protein [Desulfuromonas thiophila]|nr:response regulator receiver protein [Desulfuromonas thiophila]
MNSTLDVLITRVEGRTATQEEQLHQLVSQTGGRPLGVANLAEAVSALRNCNQPIVLLSEHFDRSSALEMIRLLRQCNRRVRIILLADTDNVSFLRQARSAGIFYHALEPRSEEDLAELKLALHSAVEQCHEQQQTEQREHRLWRHLTTALG